MQTLNFNPCAQSFTALLVAFIMSPMNAQSYPASEVSGFAAPSPEPTPLAWC